MTPVLHGITLHVTPDPDPDLSYLDADDLHHLSDGNLYHVTVSASAEVGLLDTVQTIRSGGLHGVESWLISSHYERSEEYIRTCLGEQHAELQQLLLALGISRDAIGHAPVRESWEG